MNWEKNRAPNHLLRDQRRCRGLTQDDVARALSDLAWQQLGLRVGVDAGMVSKWERGEKLPRRTYRRLLCQVFGVHEQEIGFPTLVPQTQQPTADVEENVDRNLLLKGATALGAASALRIPTRMASGPATSSPAHSIRGALARVSLDSPLGNEHPPVPLLTLRQSVNRAWDAFQGAEYSDFSQRVSRLLVTLQQAVRSLDGEERRVALGLLAEAYQVVAYTLTKLGDPQAAWLAADRGMVAARDSEDDLIFGGTAAVLSYALRESGHPVEAEQLCVSAAESLEPTMSTAGPDRLSIYGLLLLKGSVAAAQSGGRERVKFLLSEADRTAQRLGVDCNYYHTSFGPTSVKLYRVAVAVDLEDGSDAVNEARGIIPSQLAAKERFAHLLIDVARGYGQWGKTREALGTLLAAERFAPEEARGQSNVRQLVEDLLRKDVLGRSELKALAKRIGVSG